MAQNLDLNINVNTDEADRSIGSLKKQLREAQAEVTALSEKFGATSKQAIEAARRAAELRDRIADAKALTDAFNPDAKFKALTASLSGVAGGFAAVQGAMGLLGSESQDVQKMLLKVQSAMAISQGLQAVGEAVDSFKNLSAVIQSTTLFQAAYNFVLGKKVVVTEADIIATEAQTVATVEQGAATVATTTAVTGATTAMKAFRVALIASGIGLLIVAIGLAVQAFSNYVGAAAKAEEAQNKLNKQISDGAKVALDAEKHFLEGQEKLEIARAKAKGASEQEIFEIEQKYRRLRAESHQRHYEEVYGKDAKAAEESSAEINKINTDGQIAALENEARIRKVAQERKEKEKADNLKALEDKIVELEKLTEIEYNAEIKKYETLKELRDKLGRQEAIDYKELAELDREQKEEDQRIADERANELTQGYWGKRAQIQIEGWSKEAQMDKDFKEAQLQAENELQDAKFAAVSAGFNLLATLAGKNERLANVLFIADRALAIAQVVINTQKEIAANNANPTWSLLPDGGAVIKKAANTAARIRAGVSIATIAATSIAKFKSGGGGGVQDGGGVSTQAPMIPQLPQAQTTNISRQSINDLGNQAVRAYVIETDVTGNQQRMAAIRQRARFS